VSRVQRPLLSVPSEHRAHRPATLRGRKAIRRQAFFNADTCVYESPAPKPTLALRPTFGRSDSGLKTSPDNEKENVIFAPQ
jgi:hypothetical protein